jgi:hypothetical protein
MEVKKEGPASKARVLKSKRVHFNVTPEEKNQLEILAKAGNYRATSKYILECALNPKKVKNKRDNLKLLKEINKIGVNINQIAKFMNELGNYEKSLSIFEVIEHHLYITSTLISLDRQLKKLREEQCNDSEVH